MPVVRRNTLGEIQTPLHICQRAVRECDSRIKPLSTKLVVYHFATAALVQLFPSPTYRYWVKKLYSKALLNL